MITSRAHRLFVRCKGGKPMSMLLGSFFLVRCVRYTVVSIKWNHFLFVYEFNKIQSFVQLLLLSWAQKQIRMFFVDLSIYLCMEQTSKCVIYVWTGMCADAMKCKKCKKCKRLQFFDWTFDLILRKVIFWRIYQFGPFPPMRSSDRESPRVSCFDLFIPSVCICHGSRHNMRDY